MGLNKTEIHPQEQNKCNNNPPTTNRAQLTSGKLFFILSKIWSVPFITNYYEWKSFLHKINQIKPEFDVW